MSNGLLNVSGLTTPKVTTEEIILKGEPISDALANEIGDFVIENFRDGAKWYHNQFSTLMKNDEDLM